MWTRSDYEMACYISVTFPVLAHHLFRLTLLSLLVYLYFPLVGCQEVPVNQIVPEISQSIASDPVPYSSSNLQDETNVPLVPRVLIDVSPIAPLVTGALYAAGETGVVFAEYGYEHNDVLAFPVGNLGYLVIKRKVFGYRHGPYYGLGVFLEAPPFKGQGFFHEGYGFNLWADLLASYNMWKGRLLAQGRIAVQPEILSVTGYRKKR